MRKLLVAIILIGILFVVGACSDDADRSFTIDKVSIDAQIDTKGVMHVRELFTYTFDGSYEGMTRSIESDIHNFAAYLVEDEHAEPTIETEDLKPLTIEKDEETYKVYSESKNESKQVLYSYDVQGSVDKYADIGDITYAFFDGSNETDLHNLSIAMHTSENTLSDDTYSFLEDDGTGLLTITDNSLLYTNDLLEAGQQSMLRFIFPAEALSRMKVTKDKVMKEQILAAENELIERRAELGENMKQINPIIWILIGVMIIVAIFMLITHPNRYRGNKGIDELVGELEKTDLLFISYLDMNGAVSDESIVPALLSLKKQGIITLQEVSSKFHDTANTYRFTWINSQKVIDTADDYLQEWLFTEVDAEGNYFLLESITDNPDETESVKEEKSEEFEKNLTVWKELVKNKESYQNLRQPFIGFSLLSIVLTVMTFGLFYYFTKIDAISQTEQWLLPVILGVLGVIGLIFNRKKWVLLFYYAFLIFASLIAFTLTGTAILAVVFYVLAYVVLLIIPAYYWKAHIRLLKYAINKAYHLIKTNEYPIGSDPAKLEERLEYAIVLGAGEEYAEQFKAEGLTTALKESYPLLNNPTYATKTFNSSNLVLYSSVVIVSNSSSSSSTSSTGGGGAGAF